jgi:hypothetical protein
MCTSITLAQGFEVRQSGVELTVVYLEPDMEMDETTPLTDLASTHILIQDGENTLVAKFVEAAEPTGGQRIEQVFSIEVPRGQAKDLTVTVTAFDLAGNESDPVVVTKLIDRIPPGQVKKAP